MPKHRAHAQLAARFGPCLGKKAIIFPANQAVALTGSLLKLNSVDDADLPALASDDAFGLQLRGGLGDALASNTQHGGDEFLGAVYLARAEQVHAEKHPAAKLLFQPVMAVAHHQLGHMRHQELRVAQALVHQPGTAYKLTVQGFGAYSPGLPCRLHHSPGG